MKIIASGCIYRRKISFIITYLLESDKNKFRTGFESLLYNVILDNYYCKKTFNERD